MALKNGLEISKAPAMSKIGQELSNMLSISILGNLISILFLLKNFF